MGWWVTDLLESNPALLVSQFVWVIGSIVLHELAHGWAAMREGDDTPRALGHMTWNPLVHMGWFSLLMFALVGIAWGAMPVNPSRFRRGYTSDIIVSAAGPAMNLALAAASIVVGALWITYAGGVGQPLHDNFTVFFVAGGFLNIFLALFNLLPVPPLDGSKILAGFSPWYRGLIEHPNAQMIAMMVFLLVFMRFGEVVMGPAMDATAASIRAVRAVLP